MATFSKTQTARRDAGAIETAGQTFTHEGGVGYVNDARTELFRLAVTSFWKDTYYESADERRARMVKLVAQVAQENPEWMPGFVSFLRNKANMRSMPIAIAAEYAMVNGPGARQVVNAAIARADEPCEMLGYLFQYHGRRVRSAVKRGIGDAVRRTWDEYTARKYDGQSRAVRMADVLNVCHVKPKDAKQAALFSYLLDRRHGHKVTSEATLALIPRVAVASKLNALDVDKRREVFSAEVMRQAGWTWENVAGWLPGGMDAEAWEATIPNMGYFALLRNLRNFTEAKVSKSTMRTVLDKLADPEYVAKSRVLPVRFYQAYRALNGLYASELGEALEASFANAPKFGGSTLIMVDTSGSMDGDPSHQAAVLANVFRRQCDDSRVVMYATSKRDISEKLSGLNILEDVKTLVKLNGSVGHGTSTWNNTNAAFKAGNYDRVVVLTDVQDHPSHAASAIPADVPVYVWDLAGYRPTNIDTSVPNRFLFSGLNDKMLEFVSLYEKSKRPDWDALFNG